MKKVKPLAGTDEKPLSKEDWLDLYNSGASYGGINESTTWRSVMKTKPIVVSLIIAIGIACVIYFGKVMADLTIETREEYERQYAAECLDRWNRSSYKATYVPGSYTCFVETHIGLVAEQFIVVSPRRAN